MDITITGLEQLQYSLETGNVVVSLPPLPRLSPLNLSMGARHGLAYIIKTIRVCPEEYLNELFFSMSG